MSKKNVHDPEAQVSSPSTDNNSDIILPVKKRNCTDKLCLILIMCSWFAMMLIGLCATGVIQSDYISEGDPDLLFHGVDYMGNICSVHGPVSKLPFKLMPNYFGTTASSTGLNSNTFHCSFSFFALHRSNRSSSLWYLRVVLSVSW
jgi:hypothetical protein